MRSGVIIFLLILVLAGCGDSGRPGSGVNQPAGEAPTTGLSAALSRVRATGSAREHVEYGDLDAIRALAKADRARFTPLGLASSGTPGGFSQTLPTELGFDPLSLHSSVKAGVGGDDAGILWGDYDVGAVNDKFAAHGVERSDDGGATTWTIDLYTADASGVPLVMMAGGTQVRTRSGSYAYGRNRDTLMRVTDPGADTLATDPMITALATCLGDVVAARIDRVFRGTQTIAVGIRAPSASDVTAVICIAPGNTDEAKKIRATAATNLADGMSPGGRPWRQVFPDPTTELTGTTNSVLRILAEPATEIPPVTIILDMDRLGLPELLGLR